MSIQRQEDVVKLEITVDDTVLVEVLERQANFCRIELRALGAKLTTLDVQHQIATADVLHDKVYSGLGLEAGVEVGQEGMAFAVGN
jgi:hypothetical protein